MGILASLSLSLWDKLSFTALNFLKGGWKGLSLGGLGLIYGGGLSLPNPQADSSSL